MSVPKGCEVSIYSTCKRISTKLLRNVTKFLDLIYEVLKCERLKVIRGNQVHAVFWTIS